MFDCGVHPAFAGVAALPVFDDVDLSKVDLCLVTHFHLDHCGALPYLLRYTNFRGRTYMTQPTKAICNLIWQDYARMAKIGGSNDKSTLYFQDDIDLAMESILTLDFHQEFSYNGIKFSCYGAGHVLGACMFLIEIDGVRVLYTGDYSREDDRHVPRAEIPPMAVDVLIVESTYGISIHEPRFSREARLQKAVNDVLKRGGKCLLPVFALGRAQELLLILDELWERQVELQSSVPIIYVSPMASKSTRVFESFILQSGQRVRELSDLGEEPYRFKHVKTVRRLDGRELDIVEGPGPAVVLAAPGMLQSGASRELFERWAPDARNGVVITGYSVHGTVAAQLKHDPHKVSLGDRELPVRCSVDYVSFSAHADYAQTKSFIHELNPRHVILVHGEVNEMGRLQKKLLETFPGLSVQMPRITQRVILTPGQQTAGSFSATAVGRAAEIVDRINNKEKENVVKESGAVIRNLPADVSDETAEGGEIPSNSNGEKFAVTLDNDDLEGEEMVIIVGSEGAILTHPDELDDYLPLPVCTLRRRLLIPVEAKTPWIQLSPILVDAIKDIHGNDEVQLITKGGNTNILTYSLVETGEMVSVEMLNAQRVISVSWQSSPLADIIGESITQLITIRATDATL